jgi:hypothetical protein
MKILILLSILLFVTPIYGQSSLFWSQETSGVRIENKEYGSDEDVLRKEKLLESAFTEAIKTYFDALSEEKDTQLKKIIGPFQSKTSLKILQGINITVLILTKKEGVKKGDDDPPTTYLIPSLFGKGVSFVTHVPYDFVHKAIGKEALEHLAFHEIGHIVKGDYVQGYDQDKEIENEEGESPADRAVRAFIERERRVECIVYSVVKKEKYTRFLHASLKSSAPEDSEQTLAISISRWMYSLGMDKQ